jgi:hypothetical protein
MGVAARDADIETWWRGVREASDRCNEALTESRRPNSIARYLNLEALSESMTSIEHFREYVGRASALGFTDIVIAWPRPNGPFAGDEKILEDIAAELARERG